MLKTLIASELASRLFRTFLQVLFGMIAVDGVPIFDEAQTNMLIGAVGLVLSTIPTVVASFKAARAKRAQQLLNAGAVTEAKLVASGQKS